MTAPSRDEKKAPVQGYSAGIPWDMHLRAYDGYCKKFGPQQALIEGWCRGGFSTGELDMFIPGWREELDERKKLSDQVDALTRENRELREALEWALPFALKAPDPTRSEDDVPSDEWLNKKKQARAALAKKEAVQLLQENASTDKKLH